MGRITKKIIMANANNRDLTLSGANKALELTGVTIQEHPTLSGYQAFYEGEKIGENAKLSVLTQHIVKNAVWAA